MTAAAEPIHLTPTLPAAFTPVSEGLPNQCKTVLGIRECSTRASKFEVLTVRHMPNYRPNNPWQTVDNDAVRAEHSDFSHLSSHLLHTSLQTSSHA